MFVRFENLPKHSRVWIYQSNREFTSHEIEFISKKAIEFIEQWTRHGSDLKGSFQIKYKRFLVLAVDEGFNNVSGCSIDSSVRFVQEIEKQLNVDMMNKMNLSFRDGEDIKIVKMNLFKAMVSEHQIPSDTIVFNNMVTSVSELESDWEVPLIDSWHKRFLTA